MLDKPLPRRKFLKLGVLGGSSLIAASQIGCTKQSEPNHSLVQRKLLVLDGKESSIIVAIAEVILPSAKNFPSVEQALLVERIDEELFFVSQSIQSDFKLALSVVNTMPILYGYFSFYTNLSKNERLLCFKELQNTRFDSIRAASNAARMIINLVYFSHSSTWDLIGYDGTFAKVPEIMSEQRNYYKQLTKG
tara:strand:+ start:1607 stop:2182 length:576 start_codon:yes stop_codon:yes gene_type:complete